MPRVAVGIALAAVAVLVYAGTLGHGFVLDDGDLIEHNPWLAELSNVGRFFASDYWEPALKGGLYRPVTTLSYALNQAATGEAPAGFRALNLMLHALNTLLVWTLALRTLGRPLVAAAAALLFATHAVHTEAVVGITAGRPELLAAAFGLGSLLLLPKHYAASLALFALALLSKESAVTLVGIVVLFDFSFADLGERRLGPRLAKLLRERFVSRYLGFLVVTGLYLGLRWLALRDGDLFPPRIAVDNPLVEVGILARLVGAAEVGWRALGLLLAPLRLAYDYSYAQIPVAPELTGRGLLALAAAAALGIGWLATWRRSPRWFFALGFGLVSYSVVSNALVPIGTILGERLLYLPSVGFCLAAGLALERVARIASPPPRTQSAALLGLAIALAGLHAARGIERGRDWQSIKRLYLHDLEVSPRSAKVRTNAAGVLARWGRYEEASAHYARAIEIRPHDFVEPLQGLGFLLVEAGRLDEAVAQLERAVRVAPEDPGVLGTLAYAYYRAGRYADALRAVEASLRLDSVSPAATRREALRSEILARKGRLPRGSSLR